MENPNGGFENLLEPFVCEAYLQRKAIELLSGMDKGNVALCTKFYNELMLFKNAVAIVREELASQKQETDKLKAFVSRIEELNFKLDYAENNIPQHFIYIPNVCIEENNSSLLCGDYPADDSEESLPRKCIPPVRLFESPVGNGTYFTPQSYRNEPHVKCPASRRVETRFCPNIAYLTQEEFNSIPSYMKGRTRLTYDAVNVFIDTFNSALNKKYKIALQLVSNLRLQDKQLHMKYKKQENMATKGLYFITEEDLKSSGHFKALNTINSLISILRSLHRMYEVRGEGLVRFVVSEN